MMKVLACIMLLLATISYLAPLWTSMTITDSSSNEVLQGFLVGAFYSVQHGGDDTSGAEFTYTRALIGSMDNTEEEEEVSAIHIVFQGCCGVTFLASVATVVTVFKGSVGGAKLASGLVAFFSLGTWVFSLVEYYTSDAKEQLDEQVGNAMFPACESIPAPDTQPICATNYFSAGYYLRAYSQDVYLLPFSGSFATAVLLTLCSLAVFIKALLLSKKGGDAMVSSAY